MWLEVPADLVELRDLGLTSLNRGCDVRRGAGGARRMHASGTAHRYDHKGGNCISGQLFSPHRPPYTRD